MTCQRSLVAVFLGCAATILNAQSASDGPSIRWHPIGSSGPPQTFLPTPALPTTTNLVSFVAPTDGQIYGNDCFASTSFGLPMIAVDAVFQTVNVSFSAPPNWLCPDIFAPVSGVEGDLGLLRAGAWTFNLPGKSYPFNVSYVPMLLSAAALTNSLAIQLSWPVSGEAFVLESRESLGSGNWVSVTNAQITVSNRVTVQIDRALGVRFFRLHRLPLG